MRKMIARLCLSFPMYYLVNEGCRKNGITNFFAVLGLSILVILLYDVAQSIRND